MSGVKSVIYIGLKAREFDIIIPEEIIKNIIVQKCVIAINIIIPEKFIQKYIYPDWR